MPARLPQLGPPSRVYLPQRLVLGFVARQRQRFAMIDYRFDRGRPYLAVRPEIDLSKVNKAERRMFVFDRRTEEFRVAVNKELSGGTSYPILATALGIGGGLISSGGSTAFGLILTALDLMRRSQNLLIREGDELWHMEVVGTDTRGYNVHSEMFVLWDPYRREGTVPSNWVIHEERRYIDLGR